MKMPRRLLAALLVFAPLGLAHAQKIEPGLWEYRHEMRTPGQPGLAQQMAQAREQLQNLPPEARRMAEEQMAKMGIGIGDGGTIRACLTPEDTEDVAILRNGPVDDDCTYSDVQRSGNTWRGKVTCTDPPSRGEFVMRLHGATHFTAETTHVSDEDGRMEMTIEAKRVSRDCGALGK